MEKMPFHQLLGLAWRLSLRSHILWFFGFFLVLSSLLTDLIFSRFFPGFPDERWDLLFASLSGKSFTLLLLFLAVVFFVRVFGKSGLIAAIPLALPHARLSHNFQTLNPGKILRNWRQALFLEGGVFLFLLFLAFIFSAPAFYSYFFKPAAFDSLVLFSSITFFLFLLFALFVKELALFYLLLSRLSTRASLENGYALLVRFFPRCLAFGVYSLAVLLLFTFCLDLFILTLGESLSLPLLGKLVISVFFLTWFGVLYQALWFFFFRDLATPPAAPEEIREKEDALLDEKIPEIPPVGNKGV